jgi:signal transduction histidine kinase
VTWTNSFDPDLSVYADDDQLLRALVNIGRNAVQALDGQANAAITITAKSSTSDVSIDITDNGPGLPDVVRGKLFEPFSRKGRSDGTGLGLAIARELVRGHGGDVVLVKSDAAGTTFRIALPNQASDADDNA